MKNRYTRLFVVLCALILLYSCRKEREAEIEDTKLSENESLTEEVTQVRVTEDNTLVIDAPHYFPFLTAEPVPWQYNSPSGLFFLGREGVLTSLVKDEETYSLTKKWSRHSSASLARIYSNEDVLYIQDIYGSLYLYDFRGNLLDSIKSPANSIPLKSVISGETFQSILEDGYYMSYSEGEADYQKLPFDSVQYAEILPHTHKLVLQSEDSLHLLNLSDFSSYWSVHEENMSIKYSFYFNDHLYVWKNDLSLSVFSMANGLLMEDTGYSGYDLTAHHGLFSLLKSDKSWQIKKGQDDFFTLPSVSEKGGFLFAHSVLYLWTSQEGLFCLNPDNARVFWNLKTLPEDTATVSEWEDNLLVIDEQGQIRGFVSSGTRAHRHWPSRILSLPEASLDLSAEEDLHVVLLENAYDEEYVIQQRNSADNPASLRLFSSGGSEIADNALYAGFSDTLIFRGSRGEKYYLEIKKPENQAEKRMLFKIYKKNV